MTHIGFTGTQRGMTDAQGERVLELLSALPDFIAHHGDCVGADTHFDFLARLVSNFRGMVIHPPDNDSKRAFCVASLVTDAVCMPRPYLVRNQDIVDESHRMIVCPKEDHEVLRSGTWATYRRAVAANAAGTPKPIAICFPNGAVAYDGSPW